MIILLNQIADITAKSAILFLFLHQFVKIVLLLKLIITITKMLVIGSLDARTLCVMQLYVTSGSPVPVKLDFHGSASRSGMAKLVIRFWHFFLQLI